MVPGTPARALAAVVVGHQDLADRPRAAHRAGAGEPVSRGGDRAAAFGGGVVLVHARPPPVQHGLLDANRAGRGGMDEPPHRGQVVAPPGRLGQHQHPLELGRHHVGTGHPVAVDPGQRLLGLPLVHVDQRVPHVQRGPAEQRHRGVVVGRRDQVDPGLPGSHAEELQQHGAEFRGILGAQVGQRPAHPLGPAGRPRRVVHAGSGGPPAGHRVRLARAQLGHRDESGDTAVAEARAARQRRPRRPPGPPPRRTARARRTPSPRCRGRCTPPRPR